MKQIIFGDCVHGNLFQAIDPDISEADFEEVVVRAICCLYKNYQCFIFSGGFRLDGEIHIPDLALVAKDRSHWFIIEVELVSHSFKHHVLPQVKTFRYGDPLPNCSEIIAKELSITRGQADTILKYVPRSVAVIVNRPQSEWSIALGSHGVQLISVGQYACKDGRVAIEMDGILESLAHSYGWGTYTATDRSLRFPRALLVADGTIQIFDLEGSPGVWSVSRTKDATWITKETGIPNIIDGAIIQLIKTSDNRLLIRG